MLEIMLLKVLAFFVSWCWAASKHARQVFYYGAALRPQTYHLNLFVFGGALKLLDSNDPSASAS
jgi:hypothetical protein